MTGCHTTRVPVELFLLLARWLNWCSASAQLTVQALKLSALCKCIASAAAASADTPELTVANGSQLPTRQKLAEKKLAIHNSAQFIESVMQLTV